MNTKCQSCGAPVNPRNQVRCDYCGTYTPAASETISELKEAYGPMYLLSTASTLPAYRRVMESMHSIDVDSLPKWVRFA